MTDDAGRRGQLPLPFLPGRSYAEEDFVPGTANEEARAWLARWPDWPSGRLVLWGPEGSGKSHLAALWRRRSGASSLSGAMLAQMEPESVPGLLAPRSAMLVEDLGAGQEGRSLLHLINAATEAGASLLMTARQPPARWSTSLPDLRSRLAATASVAIAGPDEALVGAVLAKLLADRQVTLRAELVEWLVLRAPRDFSTIHALAAALDTASLAAGKRVTRALAAAALAEALAATGHEPLPDPAPPGQPGDADADTDPGHDKTMDQRGHPSHGRGPLE